MRVDLIGDDFKLHPITKNELLTRYELDFGVIKQGDKANFEIVVNHTEEFLDFKAVPSCGGCTTVKYKRLSDNQYKVIVEYDSVILGKINKSVHINYTDKKGVKSIHIKMIGLIIR